MTEIRPILFSVGLHASAVLLLALVPFGVNAMLEHRRVITTDLVELPPPIIERPAVYQVPSSPQIVQKVEHRTNQFVPKARPVPHRNPVQRPEPARVATAPAHSPMVPSMEVVPDFIAIPPSARLAFQGARSTDREFGLGQDAGPAVGSLSLAGAMPSLRRTALASAPAMPRLLRDSSADHAATAKSKVRTGDNLRPEYPRLAREAGWEGTVMLQVEVLPDGRAGTVKVHTTSGYNILDEAAVSAIQRWRFSPATDGNFSVAATVHLPVKFDLRAP